MNFICKYPWPLCSFITSPKEKSQCNFTRKWYGTEVPIICRTIIENATHNIVEHHIMYCKSLLLFDPLYPISKSSYLYCVKLNYIIYHTRSLLVGLLTTYATSCTVVYILYSTVLLLFIHLGNANKNQKGKEGKEKKSNGRSKTVRLYIDERY